MSNSLPEPSADADNRTRVQSVPPQTQEISNDSTNPTFGPSVPGGIVSGYPFLSPPLAADEIGRLGGHRILKLLGEGGMGFVFRAEDPALKRFVALKVMRPEVAAKAQAGDRFLREGRSAAILKSDHIITVYSVGQDNGVPFLAMEFLEGLPLDAWMKAQKKPVPLNHALRIVRDTLRGLATAHEKSLVHRDIKPANLWLEKGTSRIKILDFGLTRCSDADMQLTQEGAVVGTPAYMAPEQASGKPVDARADLFSVGVVLYHLLAGKNPFARGSLMETLGAIGYETQPPVATTRPDVPQEYSDFLDRLLAKDPAHRPANGMAALAELAAIEKKLADVTRTVGPLMAIPLPAPESAPQVWGALTEYEGIQVRTTRLEKTRSSSPSGDDVPRKPPNRKLLLGGGLFAFLLLLGGIIIVITNKDGSKTTIELPEGVKGEVKDGGKTVATFGGKKAPPKKVTMDADRKAAEFVLANGGKVTIGERTYQPNDAGALPEEPFKCLAIDLPARELTDAEAQMLFSLSGLESLSFNYALTEPNLGMLVKLPAAQTINSAIVNAAELTDAGLKSFRNLHALRYLRLANVRFSGAGFKDWAGWELQALFLEVQPGFVDDNLKFLKDLPKLQHIHLNGNIMTDVGVRHLGDIRTLTELNLFSTMVRDAGVVAIESLPNLQILKIQNGAGPTVTRDCLKSVAKIKSLRSVVVDPSVRDADVQPLLGLENLSDLILWGPNPEFTDTGLTTLAGIKSLAALNVGGSRVTPEGIKKFKATRPNVILGGDLLALADPDRAAATFVIGKGGTVQLQDVGYVSELAKLPSDPFKLLAIELGHLEGFTDADLDAFRDLTVLNYLSVRGPITDAGLKKLATFPCAKQLGALLLCGSQLTDTGLAALTEFPKLYNLRLDQSKAVTGTGFAKLQGKTAIKQLSLTDTGLTDAGLATIKETWAELNNFYIMATAVTDEGMKHLGGIKLTGLLQMQQCTNVTDAGFRHLEKLTALEMLEYANFCPKITAASLASVAKMTSLKVLAAQFEGSVSDADLKPLAAMKNLATLHFISGNMTVTDSGLASLGKLPALKALTVLGDKITAEGTKAFHAARPDVKLTTRHGTLEPVDPDRAAALLVIGKGGSVNLPDGRAFNDMKSLPAEPFKLQGIYTANDPTACTDADLDQFRDLTALVYLHVHGPITDAGIAKFATSPAAATLSNLVVNSTELTDAAFTFIPKFKSLTRLILEKSPKITGSGLIHLKGLPVQTLRLGNAALADAELAKLKDLPNLTTLDLTGTPITDTGLMHIGGLKHLTELSLYNVKTVTDAGAKHLEGLTELVNLHVNGVPFGEAGFASLAKLPKLKSLHGPYMSNVTDAGMKALAKSPSLESAALGATPLTDAGLAALAACKTLKHVQVGGTKVTAAGVKKFREARPDVEVASDFDK
jgi:serine/threonine protein kinase